MNRTYSLNTKYKISVFNKDDFEVEAISCYFDNYGFTRECELSGKLTLPGDNVREVLITAPLRGGCAWTEGELLPWLPWTIPFLADIEKINFIIFVDDKIK